MTCGDAENDNQQYELSAPPRSGVMRQGMTSLLDAQRCDRRRAMPYFESAVIM